MLRDRIPKTPVATIRDLISVMDFGLGNFFGEIDFYWNLWNWSFDLESFLVGKVKLEVNGGLLANLKLP